LSDPDGLAFNSAGDLFAADAVSGNIYEFTPGGARSTFASGLDYPQNLAFNSAGDLFEADAHSGNIYEFTPGGAQSTFASGLGYPFGLAFQPVPEPSAFGLLAVGATALLVRRHTATRRKRSGSILIVVGVVEHCNKGHC
jgi:fructose 1,6-bisphosphatase